ASGGVAEAGPAAAVPVRQDVRGIAPLDSRRVQRARRHPRQPPAPRGRVDAPPDRAARRIAVRARPRPGEGGTAMTPARLVIVAALAAAAFALPATARANEVTASCTLGNLQTVDCGTWHPGPLTLRWDWDPFGTETMTSGCSTKTFTSDTPPSGSGVTCTVPWGADPASHTATARLAN